MSEAEYAHSKRKRIVPLRMEADYKPDDWLGPLCLNNLHYDFSDCSDETKFNDEMSRLLAELKQLGVQASRTGLSLHTSQAAVFLA